MTIRETFEARHSPNRRKTHVHALLHADGNVLIVVIRDICCEGMKIALDARLDLGTPVTVEMMKTRVPALVHWCENGFAGLRMLERLDRDTLVALETADDDLAEYR